jgi:DNA-binding CsgD family transcriptional regulator
MLWARSLLLESKGAVEGAYQALAQAWNLCASVGIVSEFPVLGPDLVRLALAVGDHPKAENVAESVERLATDTGVASVVGAALRCRGLLSGDSAILLAAVDAYRRSNRPLFVAAACEEAASALVIRGMQSEAVPLLREAVNLYGQLEAVRDSARTVGVLRKLGFPAGVRGPRKRPTVGWASLTPSERRVVDLAVEGLTNAQIAERLFISHRTVQTHLTHVFAKLRLSSRAELAAAVARRQRSSSGV